MKAHICDAGGTLTLSVNNNVIYTNTNITTSGTYTATTTGTFTSPSLQWRAHATGTAPVGFDLESASLLVETGRASQTLRVKGFEGSVSFAVNQIRTKRLG